MFKVSLKDICGHIFKFQIISNRLTSFSASDGSYKYGSIFCCLPGETKYYKNRSVLTFYRSKPFHLQIHEFIFTMLQTAWKNLFVILKMRRFHDFMKKSCHTLRQKIEKNHDLSKFQYVVTLRCDDFCLSGFF